MLINKIFFVSPYFYTHVKLVLRLCFISAILLFTDVSFCKIQEHSNFDWAQATLNKLTLREKIGQLFVVAATSKPESLEEKLASKRWVCPYNLDDNYIKKLIKDYNIGGIIFLYDNSPELQLKKIREYQAVSKIPLLITQDCEWGLNMRHPDIIKFPRNLTLGAIQDSKLIYELGLEIGRQCKLVGVHMNFSPVADINFNPYNSVIHDRSFGDNPKLVAKYSYFMMAGLQHAGILVCPKHFPGHGDTTQDSHFYLPILNHSFKRLESVELVPFKYLIKNHADAIMPGHLNVPALDDKNIATFSKKIIKDLLEDKLCFSGLKITDALGMGAVTKSFAPGEIEHKAFLAGFDILLCPLDVEKAVSLIEKSILSGEVSEAELDKRVLKILQAKSRVILNNNSNNIDINPEKIFVEINSQGAKNLKAKLYKEAVTIVKDKYNLIPVKSPDDSIIVFLKNLNKYSEQNFGINSQDLINLKNIKNMGKKLIVVLYGTPYAVKLVDSFADAIIVAYENDPDAYEAVENVLSGKYKATGKLPIKL